MQAEPYLAALVAGLVIAGAVAAACGLVLRRLPASWPLGDLRGHNELAPALGGFAVLAAFAFAPPIAVALSSRAADLLALQRGDFWALLGAASFVFLVGLIHDLRTLTAWPRLAGQLVAATAVYAGGFQIDALELPLGAAVELRALALPATLLWVVVLTNAFNLTDGKDGLAPGVCAIAAGALALIAGDTAAALLLVALAGATLGFLLFSLPTARLSLGESGATCCGFVLATLSIPAATTARGEFVIAFPLLALGLPAIDTALAVVRRALDRRSPLHDDHDHIHHRIESLDLGRRLSLALLYLLAAAFAAAALIVHYVESLAVDVALFLALASVSVATIARLGYFETMWDSTVVRSLRRRRRDTADEAG